MVVDVGVGARLLAFVCVMVSTCAFLASVCLQCYRAGLSLDRGFSLPALVSGIFLKLVVGLLLLLLLFFLQVLRFPPLLHRFMVSAQDIKPR